MKEQWPLLSTGLCFCCGWRPCPLPSQWPWTHPLAGLQSPAPCLFSPGGVILKDVLLSRPISQGSSSCCRAGRPSPCLVSCTEGFWGKSRQSSNLRPQEAVAISLPRSGVNKVLCDACSCDWARPARSEIRSICRHAVPRGSRGAHWSEPPARGSWFHLRPHPTPRYHFVGSPLPC